MSASANGEGINWDGKVHAYRPASDWRERVSPDLAFHDEVAEDLDPVTFEVIRHRLWTINQAHGETVTRISGSPVLAAYDFNMTVMTEDAELVLNAPYIQYLDSGAPIAIRYVLEHFSGDPGINEGDVYMGNDPWIGAVHQMDVLICMPIFVDGKLFAWTSNAGHNYDLGGIVPGGWPQNAVDVYYDPVVLPPFKIIEAGEARPDLEQMYLRQSRMPDLVALDFRAQIGGVNFARDAILELCEQFGAPTVKAAMRRILDDGQKAFAEKLRKIPDGRFSRVVYLDEKLPGERETQRVQLNFTKKGDRLIVDNEGTDAQEEGPNGFVFTGFAGGVLGILSITMMHESLFAIGGGDRQIDYEPTPGLLNCVDYPAAVAGSVLSIVSHMYSTLMISGQMLATDPELKEDVIVGMPEWPLVILTGLDAEGGFYGHGLLEGYAMGSGARSFADGVDTAGPLYSPLSFLMNVEAQEQFFPIVYLYRKVGEDVAAAGRWRGGASYVTGVMPYKAQSMSMVTFVGGQGASTNSCPGLMGGYPSGTAQYVIRKDTDVAARMAAGDPPADVAELRAAEDVVLRGKSNGTPVEAADVFEIRIGGGGGYGDPLLREPERVAADVAAGVVSAAVAAEVYGVVLAGAEPDAEATAARRERMRAARAAWPAASELHGDGGIDGSAPATGAPPRAVHEYVVARDEGGDRVLACAECDQVLSGARGSYKRGLLLEEGPVTAIPLTGDPARFIDAEMLFRRYCCPGCQVLMSTEVARRGEDVFDDFVLEEGA